MLAHHHYMQAAHHSTHITILMLPQRFKAWRQTLHLESWHSAEIDIIRSACVTCACDQRRRTPSPYITAHSHNLPSNAPCPPIPVAQAKPKPPGSLSQEFQLKQHTCWASKTHGEQLAVNTPRHMHACSPHHCMQAAHHSTHITILMLPQRFKAWRQTLHLLRVGTQQK